MERSTRIALAVAGALAVASGLPAIASAQRSTDVTPPRITQSDITVPATAGFGSTFSANITLSPTVSDPDDATSTIAVSCNTALGTTFLAGTGLVTCTASDPAGNRSSVTFHVTVTVPGPAFSATSPITVPATSSEGAVVTWPDVTATDVAGQSDTVSCDHQSGIAYPIGTTTVTCSASVIRHDSVGNVINWASGQTQFTVTVTPQAQAQAASPGGWTGSSAGSGGGSGTSSSGSATVSGATGSTASASSGNSSTSGGASSSGSTGSTSAAATTSGSAASGPGSSAGSSTAPTAGSVHLAPAAVKRSGSGETVSFGVTLGAGAPLHVAIVSAGGKLVARFTVQGHEGLNDLSAYLPASAARQTLTLRISVSAHGQTHTITERIRPSRSKTHRTPGRGRR